jgi:sec-independent protein translocase protein TatC
MAKFLKGSAEMPFLDHLEELRWRIVYSLVALCVGMVVAFVLLQKMDVIRFLEQPVLPYLHGRKLVFTHPGDPFSIVLNASVALGIVLASPVIGYQAWAFFAPALYSHEKKLVVPVLVGAVLLFLCGLALSFFVVLPFTLSFLLNFQTEALEPMITASEYFGFAISMSLAFGAVFELPILILALTALGIVTPAFLTKYRRHAIVLCVVAAAFITPGADPTSLFALSVPLYLLYELSVVLSRAVYVRRQRRMEAPVVAALLLLLAAPSLRAQVPAQPPVVRPPTIVPTPGDTTRRDSTRAPGTPGAPGAPAAPAELVKWAATDSVLEALLKREGYNPVRYQGDTVRFRADDRVLSLVGKPAAVQREDVTLVGRAVVYNDSTQIVTATADTARRDSVVMRQPNQADLVVQTSIVYNVATQQGTIRDFRTAATQGETWYVSGARGAVVADTTVQGGRIFFAHNGSITSCNDSIPHYHFQAKDIKYVTKSLLVVRPAVLYIGDVPVLWLPFVFQDTRSGRRSGLLTPRFGIAELLRNSANYKRSLENLGYYFNMGDYADAQAWFDWRSGSHGDSFDPGWVRFNAETRYKVVTRFIQGRLSASYLAQRDGSRNTAISLAHEQSFNQNRRIAANLNWVQSTTLQRQNTYNPSAVLGTISSQLNYSDKFGPVSLNAGGSRKQYPGRPQVDQDFPNINLSTGTLSLASWLDWTPTLSLSNAQSFKIDQGTQFDSVFKLNATGQLQASAVRASRRNTNVGFETPLKIFDFQWQNSLRYTETVEDYPATRVIFRDIRDTTTRETRVFNQTYTSNLFYSTNFSLPRFFQGTWNVSPTVSIQNIDPQFGMFVRTERTGGQWVNQGFRLAYGISSSPTFYAFPPGFGPVERFRHSISPSLQFSYSPAADVSDKFLAAVGTARQGYLGSLKQARLSLQLTSNLEAKLKGKKNDTTSTGAGGGEGGTKVKLLSMNFTGLNYDFIIADSVGKSLFNQRGITDQTFGYSLTSDLLPGMNVRTQYSLFLGNPQSDTAVFKPYLTNVDVTFSLDRNSALFKTVARWLGITPSTPAANSAPTPTTTTGNPRGGDPFFSQQAAAQQVAGSYSRAAQFDIPSSQGWQASFTFTSSRQRPDIRGNLVDIDPTIQCQAQRQAGDVLGYELCVARAQTAPQAGTLPTGTSTYGGAVFRQPPVQSLQANSSFHLTQKWAAQWNTSYDLVRGNFASNQISLQRELHDWRAVFAFTQSPNGNFAFNFFVALKAEPDLKFDYNRNTYRSPTTGF